MKSTVTPSSVAFACAPSLSFTQCWSMESMVRGAGELLSGCCRAGDVLARTGGDEFVILAPNTDHAQADTLLSNIRKALEEYNRRLTDKALHINLSAVYSTKEKESESLVEIARQMEDSLSRQKLLDKRSHHNATLATIVATMLLPRSAVCPLQWCAPANMRAHPCALR